MDGLGSAHRNGRLLNNDLVRCSDFSDFSSAQFAVLDVGGTTGADARSLGRSVDTNKDNICLANSVVNIGRKEKIPAITLRNKII